MNLAVHGLSGDVREANTDYEDPHKAPGRFDFVMANPPFNVSGVDKDRLKDDPRFALGLPTTDNANYLWIQLFAARLNENGRAGFLMASGAEGSSNRAELEIRRRLIESGAVDVMVSIGPNMFYTVTLPCMLWFFDRGKRNGPCRNTVLFLDARPYFRQVTRAIREFTAEQLEFLANIVRLHRGDQPEFEAGSRERLTTTCPGLRYSDVPGLCKAATVSDIEAQGWSLSPGRYVGVGARAADGFDFHDRMVELAAELPMLNESSETLQQTISEDLVDLLETP